MTSVYATRCAGPCLIVSWLEKRQEFPPVVNDEGRLLSVSASVDILCINLERRAMKMRVQKWGNSLGIRIPKALAQEVDMSADSEVEILARDGKILISPIKGKTLSLRQLLSMVTPANLHRQLDVGPAIGKEAW